MAWWGHLAAKAGPPRGFSGPDPEASNATPSDYADRPRWDRLSAASTGAFLAEPAVPRLSNWLQLVPRVAVRDAGRGARWWLRQRAKDLGPGLPA